MIMGSQRMYNPNGGFSEYLYIQKGDIIKSSNGVEGKVVEKINGTSFDGLPTFSNTREVYLKVNDKGEVVQARVYKDRKPVCDFDFDHEHTNPKSGEKFPPGVVHVQEWKQRSNGGFYRDSKHARYMSNDEISRYGELIKIVNSTVKLRP